jgi:hypothetical protein
MTDSHDRTWRDWAGAVGVALAPLALYLPTMYPGLGGGGDAAKFQYLGRVLGTAHSPGYPTYVLISHLFSYLPIGTLAYRINLMSVLFGLIGAALEYFIVRRLGGSRLAACAAALGLALGRYYWSKAILAEVYSLAAAFTAGTVLKVIDWSRTRRERDLFWAVALASLAIGNHLTIAFVAPALVVYVLLVDVRTVLSPRILAISLVWMVVGVSQYLFIWVRTIQQAPYLEARASSFAELIAVVTARRYAYQMWVFDVPTLLSTRVPAVMALVRSELTWVGVALLVPGVVWFLRHRHREAVLLALGFAGMLVVTLNVDADTEGFMVPAFVMLWPFAGFGVHAIVSLRPCQRWRPLATTAGLVLLCGLVTAEVRANYRVNDHHRRTFEDRYFSALFRVLPDKAVIANDEYVLNQLVFYKLLGERAAGTRDVRLVPMEPVTLWEWVARGYTVFGFEQTRGVLAAQGYELAALQLYGPTLSEALATIDRGSVVVIAATPGVVSVLGSDLPGGTLRRIGGAHRLVGDGRAFVSVGIVGASSGAVERLGSDGVEVSLAAAQAIGSAGTPAPVSLRAQVSARSASISIAGRTLLDVDTGLVMVALTSDGRVVAADKIDMSTSPRVALDMTALPIYRVTAASRCAAIGNRGWVDVSAFAAGSRMNVRIDNYRPFDSDSVLYLVGTSPMTPALVRTEGTGEAKLAVQSFDVGRQTDRESLALDVQRDVVPEAMVTTLKAGPFVSRVELMVNDQGQYLVAHIDAQQRPLNVFAKLRVDLDNPRRAQFCAPEIR